MGELQVIEIDDESTFDEVLDEYLEVEDIRFDESDDVDDFYKVIHGIGYKGLAGFLEACPGAIEHLMEWIREMGKESPDWKANLEECLPDEN